jgi:hypothetical protein
VLKSVIRLEMTQCSVSSQVSQILALCHLKSVTDFNTVSSQVYHRF